MIEDSLPNEKALPFPEGLYCVLRQDVNDMDDDLYLEAARCRVLLAYSLPAGAGVR